ncbi:MAG: hypothetical protein FK734_01815 [Asgard group archaeon]|nr:hypothetical protein [Asgard group archaeon]
MVHEAYDNIVAILLVGLIFVGAVLLMPAISISNMQSVDYQQLRNTAVNVFDSILLNPGDPVDWGSIRDFSPEYVNTFGLAKYQNSHFYILDPDKVQRLKSGNPLGEITNDEAKEILNLDGYGFNLRIIPPFNVTNVDGTKITTENSPINATLLNDEINPVCRYDVKVSFLDGRPIGKADVQSLIVYTNGDEFRQSLPETKQTDSIGFCNNSIDLDFVPSLVIVILKIDVAEVATLVVTFGSEMPNVVDINMVGDDIILTKPDNNPTGATIFINGVYVFRDDEIATLFEDFKSKDKFTYTQSGPYEEWVGTYPGVKYYEPSLVILNYDNTEGEGGRQDFIVAGPYQNLLGYSIFEYGSPPKITDTAIRLQRSVLISGMTYTAELIFWKE